MKQEIFQISDDDAIAVVARIPQEQGPSQSSRLSEEQRNALAEHFGVSTHEANVSEGDLARQTLQLLASDPERSEAIRTMIRNVRNVPQRYDAGLSIALGTAALFILQTYVEFKRESSGKWTLQIKKQPTDAKLLTAFVQKLIPSLGK